jgi:hypothetical protein
LGIDVNRFLLAAEHVEGWLFPVDAHLFAVCSEMQVREGIRGNLFEIGVHHGKTAALLAWLAQPGEVLGVCDIFDQQELNADLSGKGNRQIFEHNMRLIAPDTALKIFAKPSSTLMTDETTTSCRLFHIDGGHRPNDVYNDLEIAHRALLSLGIVIVDDPFNANWPGVSEGLYRFFSDRPKDFAPILIGGNKAYFCRPHAVSNFRITELPRGLPYFLGQKEWLGCKVPTALNYAWVDLDPIGAARLHYQPRTLKGRMRRYLLSRARAGE